MSKSLPPKKRPEEPPKGVTCPECGCQHFYILYTKLVLNGRKREKVCRNCGRRVKTFESIQEI